MLGDAKRTPGSTSTKSPAFTASGQLCIITFMCRCRSLSSDTTACSLPLMSYVLRSKVRSAGLLRKLSLGCGCGRASSMKRDDTECRRRSVRQHCSALA